MEFEQAIAENSIAQEEISKKIDKMLGNEEEAPEEEVQ